MSRICNPLPADVAQKNFLKLLAFYNISVVSKSMFKLKSGKEIKLLNLGRGNLCATRITTQNIQAMQLHGDLCMRTIQGLGVPENYVQISLGLDGPILLQDFSLKSMHFAICRSRKYRSLYLRFAFQYSSTFDQILKQFC